MDMPVDMPVETPRIRLKKLAPVAVAIALAATVFAAPAFAQNAHGGGGGGHGSSGGQMSGGGGHAEGGHMGGGGAPHFAARPSYGAVGHGAGTYGGYAHANVNFAAPVRVGTYANAPAARANFVAGGARYVPGRYGSGAGYGHWNGGYWRGGFWPRVFWGANYAWFLPVLPAYCATYWWNNVPYYYYNDVYYTYDPSASGYVVTTPPPAQEATAPNQDSNGQDPNAQNPNAAADTAGNAMANAPDAATYNSPQNTSSASGAGLFAYPKNGQSDEQQTADKKECASWAAGQTSADGNGTSMDYQRAMTACLQGRGYSVD
jgi:hypothetical protein